MNDERGGEDVDSVEEAYMRSNAISFYENDHSVSGFDSSTYSGDNFYGIFENEGENITKDSIFGSTLIKQIGK